jgi:hypothetical protein
MERHEWTHTDKSGWPGGPWFAEPDVIAWTDEETGLPCVIARNRSYGFLCGYAGVRPGHPLHGQPAEAVTMIGHNGPVEWAGGELPNLHGAHAAGVPAATEVTALVGDAWWFGCAAHGYDDFKPAGQVTIEFDLPGEYRTTGYMAFVCQLMARQAAGQDLETALVALAPVLAAEMARPVYPAYCPRCGKGTADPFDAVHGWCGMCSDYTGVRGRKAAAWRPQ